MELINKLIRVLGSGQSYRPLPSYKKERGYIIGTGWWCDGSGTHEGAQASVTKSVDFIRDKEFFQLWYHFVQKYTKPEKIIVADSASPVRPDLPNDPRIEFLSMKKNWGHFVGSDYSAMCGVERAHLAVAFYALLNDCDLVYIEQDAIVVGENWIEFCKKHMKKNKVMFGHGKNTPQPIQQSLAIVKWEYLPIFINKLLDQYVMHSHILLNKNPDPNLHNTEHRWNDAFKDDVDYLPIGYGRKRPLNFDDPYMYAQHWTVDELRALAKRENLDPSLLPIG